MQKKKRISVETLRNINLWIFCSLFGFILGLGIWNIGHPYMVAKNETDSTEDNIMVIAEGDTEINTPDSEITGGTITETTFDETTDEMLQDTSVDAIVTEECTQEDEKEGLFPLSPVFKLQNPNTEEIFFTTNETEKQNILETGWMDVGVAWYAPSTGTPVYRLFNVEGEHHYTISEEEKTMLVENGWQDEGVVFYSGGDEEIYRLYKEGSFHIHTISKEERDILVSLGWIDETNETNVMYGFSQYLQ